VVTRERLVKAVLSRQVMPFDRSIDMHVSKVRRSSGFRGKRRPHQDDSRSGYMFARPGPRRGNEKPFPQDLLSFWAAQALFFVLAILGSLLLRRPVTGN